MKYKSLKKSSLVAAIVVTSSTCTQAAVFNATASFRTIADVSITENAALTFGTAVTGKSGTTCTITSTITDGTTKANSILAAITSVGNTGCPNGVGTKVPGDYTISGSVGGSVTLLMATADTDPLFTFSPSGQFNDQNATSASVDYFSDAGQTVSLDSVAGDGRLSVGGVLAINSDLDASTSYSIAYDISVIY